MIIECDCGAKVRLPETSAQRSFRCPRCKHAFALTLDAQMIASHQAQAGDADAQCPICQAPVKTDEMVLTCPDCGQIHHHECWVEVGGCSTYGCRQMPVAGKETGRQDQSSGWGDKKTCPVCGEQIKSIARRCRYCNTQFNTADPINLDDLDVHEQQAAARSRSQKVIVAAFALSLLGVLAPIMVIVCPLVVLSNRKNLSRSEPFFLVLGYASIALSLLYSLLILAFALQSL